MINIRSVSTNAYSAIITNIMYYLEFYENWLLVQSTKLYLFYNLMYFIDILE